MLGSCEKMSTSISSSTTNEWPQNQTIDGQKILMDSSSSNKVIERSSQDPLIKCPRCSSCNTKFCYYNNYSLSQPRHFCKACKRYWTRGGTLRNVPVGGGCRKNKKVKRQPSSGGGEVISSSEAAASKSSTAQPDTDLSPTSNCINTPLFYSLHPTNHLELNFPFSRFSATRVSSDSTEIHHHQPRINDTNYPMFLGSSTFAPAPTSSTMSSLLASSLQEQRFVASGVKDVQTSNDFSGLMPCENMETLVGNGEIGKESNDVERENRLEWSSSDQIEQINNSSDSSSLFWNYSNDVGAWFDPSNMGSSVPSLI